MEPFIATTTATADNENNEFSCRGPVSDKEWQQKVDALYDHPFFMTQAPDRKALESNEHLKALQTLLYEGSPDEIAENFKNQGNDCYQMGKLKYKDALTFYSKGLEVKCPNKSLNAILHVNRAAVHLELANFRSAIEDCLKTIDLDPSSIKAHYRAARAYCAVDQFAAALSHIEKAILLEPHDRTLELQREKILKKRSEVEQRQIERANEELRKRTSHAKLIHAIQKRSIRMDDVDPVLESKNSTSMKVVSNSPFNIYLDDQGDIHWPVAILYPEYQQSDLISDFMENESFEVHLETMFPSEQIKPAVEWDRKGVYKAKFLEVYFETRTYPTTSKEARLIRVNPSSTLLSSLSDSRYLVQHGLPSFIVLCSKSPFRDEFLARYHIC